MSVTTQQISHKKQVVRILSCERQEHEHPTFFNIMAADGMGMQATTPSAIMLTNYFSQNNLVSEPKGLNFLQISPNSTYFQTNLMQLLTMK